MVCWILAGRCAEPWRRRIFLKKSRRQLREAVAESGLADDLGVWSFLGQATLDLARSSENPAVRRRLFEEARDCLTRGAG